MVRRIFWITAVLAAISWVPLALLWRQQQVRHRAPRMQILPDMDKQPKYRGQRPNAIFADGRADRRPPQGTVARGAAMRDPHLSAGRVNGDWASTLPVAATPELMRRGRERYEIFCSPCHGLSGEGDGPVAKRADRLAEGTWTPPTSLVEEAVRARPVEHLFNTITHGIRTMPPYGAQIPEHDRWAIVAYVRALQRSQRTTIEDVPPDVRPSLR